MVTHLVCQHQQQAIFSKFPSAERVSFVWVYQCALSRRLIPPNDYTVGAKWLMRCSMRKFRDPMTSALTLFTCACSYSDPSQPQRFQIVRSTKLL